MLLAKFSLTCIDDDIASILFFLVIFQLSTKHYKMLFFNLG